MNIDTKLTISRPSCGNGDEYIMIQIQDCISRERFVELKIGLREFAEAITGLSQVACSATVRGLDHVGKRKETTKQRIPIPKHACDSRQDSKNYILQLKPPHGWILDTYLDAKDSIILNGDTNIVEEFPMVANVHYYRYVELSE